MEQCLAYSRAHVNSFPFLNLVEHTLFKNVHERLVEVHDLARVLPGHGVELGIVGHLPVLDRLLGLLDFAFDPARRWMEFLGLC